MSTDTGLQSTGTDPVAAQLCPLLARQLSRLRNRYLLFGIAKAVLWVAALVVLFFVLDRWLRLPTPIRLLHDSVIVRPGADEGERRSTGGIVIPATAQVGRKLAWERVVSIGPTVRTIEVGDRVLFEPEDHGSVELHGTAVEK